MIHNLLAVLRGTRSLNSLPRRERFELLTGLYALPYAGVLTYRFWEMRRWNEERVGRIPEGVQWQYFGLIHRFWEDGWEGEAGEGMEEFKIRV